MYTIRPPAVAGSFYPDIADDLSNLLEECFVAHPLGPRGAEAPSTSLLAGLVPHAGYPYSGPCAAHFYSCLDKDIERVIILGVNHRSRGHKAALSPWSHWRTPLGEATIDTQLTESLADRISWLSPDARGHDDEHSIEVQLPFLQSILKDFVFLPISLAHLTLDECAELGEALSAVLNSKNFGKTVLIASSDLSHYLSPAETEKLDRLVIEQLVALDAPGLIEVVAQNDISMCGVIPAAVMLSAANSLGAKRARLLRHCHSGDVTPMRAVVGYVSIAIEL